MFKLLFTAITWFFFSNGTFTVPNMLVTTTESSKSEVAATDRHCKRGDWPDRARACAFTGHAKNKFFRIQGVETLVDLKPAQELTESAPTASGIRIFDATAEAAAPVAIEVTPVAAAPASVSYTLAGVTQTTPKSLSRSFVPVRPVVEEDDEEAAPAVERRRPATRAAQRRAPRYASYRPAGMVRVLGVAF